MEYLQIGKILHQRAAALTADSISEIDFRQFAVELSEAATAIERLSERAAVGNELVALFKRELLSQARAIAAATGKKTSLAEKLLAQPNLNLSQLLSLKQDIANEFDTVFSSVPLVPYRAAAAGEKLDHYKI